MTTAARRAASSASRPPTRLAAHGHERVDPWYWLRQRDNPAVIAYLRAENAHADAVMAHTRPLQERLFAEIKGRIKQTDTSVPYRIKRHLYYTRVEDGLQYPIHCRRRAARDAAGAEEVLLDVNALALGHDFYAVNVRDVSPGEDILAFAEDTRGDRVHTIRFRQLATGAMLDDALPNASGYLAWANDNRTLCYATVQPTTLRSYRLYRHLLGTDPARDVLHVLFTQQGRALQLVIEGASRLPASAGEALTARLCAAEPRVMSALQILALTASGHAPATAELLPAPSGKAAGASVFQTNCMGCHGLDARGSVGPGILNTAVTLRRSPLPHRERIPHEVGEDAAHRVTTKDDDEEPGESDGRHGGDREEILAPEQARRHQRSLYVAARARRPGLQSVCREPGPPG